MIEKEYSCLSYWRQHYQAIKPSMTFNATTHRGYMEWQKDFREKYIECLGKIPIDDQALDMKIIDQIENEHYVRRKIVYTADTYSSIPAFLFIPKGVELPAPAIICPHGHGRGKVDPAGIIETDLTSVVKEKYDKLILEDGITPIRRWGQPEDIGKAVVAIAEELMPFSTGEVINVDGGFHISRL